MPNRIALLTTLGAAALHLTSSTGHAAPPSDRTFEDPLFFEPLSCDWTEQPGYEARANQVPDVDSPDAPRNPLWLPRALMVSNTAELLEALNDPTLTDILLLPGDYDCDPEASQPWIALGDVHLWSTSVGEAVLHMGVQIQTPNGGLHGLSFDIETPECGAIRYSNDSIRGAVIVQNGTNVAPTDSLGAIIADEYAMTHVVLEDLSIDGNFNLTSGIRATAVSGLELSRIEIRETLWDGIRLDTLLPELFEQIQDQFIPPLMTDLAIEQVSDPSLRDMQCWASGISGPTYFPGRVEHGMFIGVTSTVRRVRIRDAAFTGIGLFTGRDVSNPAFTFGNASTIEHVDIDRIGPNSYRGNPHAVGSAITFDMATRDAQLSTFCTGPDTGRGVQFEYHGLCAMNDLGHCETSFHDWRTQDVTVSDGLIDAAAQVSRFNLNLCEEGQTGNEAYPLIDTQGSTGLVAGAHTEGIVTENLTIRFSGCSGMRLENMNPIYNENGVLIPGCEFAPYGPDNGPDQAFSMSSTGGGPLGCSYNENNPWYTPWCLESQQLDFDLLDSGACEISNWQVWQCDDTQLPTILDGCLQN